MTALSERYSVLKRQPYFVVRNMHGDLRRATSIVGA
jgi:hypothetical protein